MGAVARFVWRRRMIARPRPSWGRFCTPLVPGKGIGPATGRARPRSHRVRESNSRSSPRHNRQTISTCRQGGKASCPPPARGMATPPRDELILSKSGFKGIVDQTRGDDSKCLEFKKIIAFFENPLLLFRLKVRISRAPSLVSQPWVDVSSRLSSLLSL